MVKAKQPLFDSPATQLNSGEWLDNIKHAHHLKEMTLFTQALAFVNKLAPNIEPSSLRQGLEIAEIIIELKLDQETAVAGFLSCLKEVVNTKQELIQQEFNNTIAKLAIGTLQMEVMPSLQKVARSKTQLDKIRKMLLAMATDIRVVIIKLAERLSVMRSIKQLAEEEKKRIAQEILDIYAPLANRLGIGQIKWELEDLAFRYLDPITYKTIAHFLAERRIDREKRITSIITYLQEKLLAAGIKAEVTGRAKHIYSIYLKTKLKKLDYQAVYDQTAIRILVPSIEDCYAALSIAHALWNPIIDEFDDYIANPKPNGYRSIHTALINEEGKHFEIQIRTYAMHEEAERGVAAHWIYKEKERNPLDDTSKIAYLRQLLSWHQEITDTESPTEKTQAELLDDRVYVITPAGDILDLPKGATPLDFAYQLHSELGHRCRGAKINGQIVPLTYALRTGDKVEITTVLQGVPSRDWLNPELGYLKSANAKSRVMHWFKQQAFNQDVAAGRQLLERELARTGLTKMASLAMLAKHFNLKNEDALLAAISRGNVRMGQIMQAIQPKIAEKTTTSLLPALVSKSSEKQSSIIADGADLLTRLAKCCKPIPGDSIIGYITQGRGISIHKNNCTNVNELQDKRRFIQIQWGSKKTDIFSTDLKIIAHDQAKVLNDLTALFANEKIGLLSFHSTFNKNQNKIFIAVTVQIENLDELQHLLHRIQQLPGVIEVSRVKE